MGMMDGYQDRVLLAQTAYSVQSGNWDWVGSEKDSGGARHESPVHVDGRICVRHFLCARSQRPVGCFTAVWMRCSCGLPDGGAVAAAASRPG